jgi:membrane fusion protein
MLIFAFVCFGEYTRKAHLSGIVMPSSRLIKVTPLYSGYVTAQTISEGQHVNAGEL